MMMRRITVLLLALLALCIGAGALAQAQYDSYLDYGLAVAALKSPESKGGADALSARLLMRSKKALTNLEDFGPIAVVAGPDNHYTVQFASAQAALACMEALQNDANILYVQQDSLMKTCEAAPGDALSKADPYKSWGAKAMGADELAASITASGSVTVAVIDTGVGSHSFLNSRVKAGGVDFTNPSYKDGRHDVNGHGTHVAGTIVDLTQGLKVNILPVRVLGDNGYGSNSNVCNGIRYAADAGAKIINLSLGGELFSPYGGEMNEERDAIDYAVAKGVTVVVAAGNDATDTNIFKPACFDNVIVVAAINSGYNIAGFSNYGDSVDVCAPGVNITSCAVKGGFTDMNGTSMASPHVAAIAAMVKLQHPGYSPARVESAIKANCMDLGQPGWDKTFGYGMPCYVTNKAGQEGDYAYRIAEDGALITGYNGTAADITLPETLGGLPVVGVDESAFDSNATLESLRVPGCIKEIGNYAFSRCALLKSVVLDEGVVKIGDSAFWKCTALDSVSLCDSLKTIGGEAFLSCTALKALKLPDTIEAVGAYALSETGLTAFTVPAALESIPTALLLECADLETLTVEEGVSRIDPYAITYCPKLKSLSLPASVKVLDVMAFNAARLETLSMPGVTEIGYAAFYGCNNLKTLEIPEGVKTLEALTFAFCPALTEVTMPRSLTSAADDIFTNSTAVTVRGYTGSFAEKLAEDLGLPFVSIGYQVPLTALAPVSEETLEIEPGRFVYIWDLYGFEPEDATRPDLAWTSSDPSVCDFVLHEYGGEDYPALASLAEGACTITGAAQDGSGLRIEIDVVVGQLIVREVRLDKNALTLREGESAALVAGVLPARANQSIVWSSDAPDVAEVDENGRLSAHSAGTAVITAASAENENIFALCSVTVKGEAATAEDFAIRPIDAQTAAVTGYTGAAKTVSVPAVIEGHRIVRIDDKAFFKSDIESVALPEGIEEIGEKAFAGCAKLRSATLPESLTALAPDAFKDCRKLPKVKKIALRLTDAGQGFQVTPVFTPANTASAYSISVSGKKNATVDAGHVTPLTDAYFTVTVKAGGKKAVIGVADGEPYAASKVTIDGKAKRTLKMGNTLSLSYTVKPDSARVVVMWSSADPEIAVVAADGTVTPVAPGKVKITLSTDLGLSDVVTVTVK